MPEVRLETILNVELNNFFQIEIIDDRFYNVCSPESILVSSYCVDKFCLISFEVIKNTIKICSNKNNIKINLKLSGIRRDTKGIRYPEYSKEQMEKNNKFWGSWK